PHRRVDDVVDRAAAAAERDDGAADGARLDALDDTGAGRGVDLDRQRLRQDRRVLDGLGVAPLRLDDLLELLGGEAGFDRGFEFLPRLLRVLLDPRLQQHFYAQRIRHFEEIRRAFTAQ